MSMNKKTLANFKESYMVPVVLEIDSETEECIAASTGHSLNDYDNNNLLDDDEDFS